MTVELEEGGQAQQVRAGSATGAELRRLPQEVCKQTLDDWKDSVAEYVGTGQII